MPTFAYCGTEGNAVVALEMSSEGTFDQKQRFELPSAHAGTTASFVVRHPAGRHLYALAAHWDKAPGEIMVLDIGPDGLLSLAEDLTSIPSGGHQPSHAVLSGADFMLVSHLLSGSIGIFNIQASKGFAGRPQLMTQVALPDRRPPVESLLPPPPAWLLATPLRLLVRDASKFVAPADGELAPMAHGLALAPDGDFLVACDIGQGVLVSYPFEQGRLGNPISYPTPAPPATGGLGSALVAAAGGHRPKSACFSPDGRKLFVLHEASNALSVHTFDPNTGAVTAQLSTFAAFPGAQPSPPFPCGGLFAPALARCIAACLLKPSRAGATLSLASSTLASGAKSQGILMASTRGLGLCASGGLRTFKLEGASKSGLQSAQSIEIAGHPDLHGVAYSPDGKWLLVGSTGCLSAYPVGPLGEIIDEEVVHSWLGEHGGSSWEPLRSVVPSAIGSGGGSSPGKWIVTTDRRVP